ncbi:MAG: hypothetical protein MJ213_00970 [Bacilli bacterium]|nr:hypothetical protein [Bacilli bacterium]
MKKVTFIIAPLLALSFLASCNSRISAPGRTISVEEAANWVAEHFDTRVNLAKYTNTKIGLTNFLCDGLMYPAIYDKPVPIDRPTSINLRVNNPNFVDVEYKNVNGVLGSFVTENAYREDPIVGKGGTDYIINYFLNPFVDSFEITYVELLKERTDKNAFETRYSLSGDNLYITYYCNDLANITKAIKDASAQYPKMTFAIPFTGDGSGTFMVGFDKFGYVTEMLADIHSKAINFHVGLSGGEINNLFFAGEMEGKISIKNEVSLYSDNRYPHLKFRELDSSGNVKEKISYETRGVISQAEAHNIGRDYCENIGPRLSLYYDMLLPGYGSNVVIKDKKAKVSINYQGVSYPPTEGFVTVDTTSSAAETNTIIHFYPDTFDLFEGDVYVDVQLQGE